MIIFTIFVALNVPETRGKTFEQIANQFQPGGEIEVEFYVEDENVFERDPDATATDLMLASDKLRNGSVADDGVNADDVKVNIPDEKKSLTKSAQP